MNETYSQNTRLTDNRPWYAIRTFNCQERKVSRFLTEKECPHFIPMSVRVDASDPEHPKRIQVPAIHNLLFVQKISVEKEMVKMLRECPVPVSIFRYPSSEKLCEIPSRDMIELRMLCDPDFETSVFMTQGEAEAMIGKEVRVINGPFKGATGRLVRKNKQYYFLKAVIGMGVMVRISRWYCEPL